MNGSTSPVLVEFGRESDAVAKWVEGLYHGDVVGVAIAASASSYARSSLGHAQGHDQLARMFLAGFRRRPTLARDRCAVARRLLTAERMLSSERRIA